MKYIKMQEFEFSREVTVEDVMTALDYPRLPAEELLDGRLAFREEELEVLAGFLGVGMRELMREK